MYKAAVNIKLSPDYWEALMANPDSDRQAAVSKTMESVGGKLHFFGFTHGKWDALIAGEAPSEEAFMSALIKAWMAGMIQDIETIPCIDQKTVVAAMSMATQADYKKSHRVVRLTCGVLRTEEEDVKNNASSVSRLVSRASSSRSTITLPNLSIIRLRMD